MADVIMDAGIALILVKEMSMAFISHTLGQDFVPSSLLREASLADLLEACALVDQRNEETMEAWQGDDFTDPSIRKMRCVHTVPDERLVAALYAALHYEPANKDQRGFLEPIVRFWDRALVLVPLSRD